jgi:probable F420-dependent oxidoreductase
MSVRIGIGPGLGVALTPREYWRWVDYCEDAGIDSIWHSDNLLGGTMEPVALLAALAARTRRMRFGTNAIVAAFRDPIVLAKQLATIDWLSEGRAFPVFGVGNASDPYWSATGADPRARGRRADEVITLVRLLLEQETVEFEGAHYRYCGPGVFPRPARPMSLWIGGQSPAAYRRTAQLGDGWLGGLTGAAAAADARRQIELALAETGRTIEPDHYGTSLPLRIGAESDPEAQAARARLMARMPKQDSGSVEQSFAIGPPDAIVTLLRGYVASGIHKFVVLPMVRDAEDLMAQTELLVRTIIPQIENQRLASAD